MIEVRADGNFTDEQKDLIKKTVCKDATDDELKIFLFQCAKLKLDPFIKQIYSLKLGQNRAVFLGIDGFRALAERTGNYSPGKQTIYTYDKTGRVISATAFVNKRNDDGTWHEIAAEAFMDEYDRKMGLWKTMPRVMIEKCAEARALRRAFPTDFSGLYTSEEMLQAMKDNQVEEIEKTIEIKESDLKKEIAIESEIMKDIREKSNEEEADKLEQCSIYICDQLGLLKAESFESVLKYISHKPLREAFLTRPIETMDLPRFNESFCKWHSDQKIAGEKSQ